MSLALPPSQQSSYTWQQVYSTKEFFLRPQVSQFQPAATLIQNTSENPHLSRSSGGDASGVSSLLYIITAVSLIELGGIGSIQTQPCRFFRFRRNLHYSPFFKGFTVLTYNFLGNPFWSQRSIFKIIHVLMTLCTRKQHGRVTINR